MAKGMKKANEAYKKDIMIIDKITIKFIKELSLNCHFCLLAIYTVFHLLSLFEPYYPLFDKSKEALCF
ncbi:MAG: hypothetical protein ABIL20_04305 [candidate division WOR-3 bacterium]